MRGFDDPGPVPAAQQHRMAGNAVDRPPWPVRRGPLRAGPPPRRPGEPPRASHRAGRRASPAPRRSRGQPGLPSLNRMVASASSPMRRLDPMPSACPGLSTNVDAGRQQSSHLVAAGPDHHQPGPAADEHVERPNHPGAGTGVHQRLRPAVAPTGAGRQQQPGDRRTGRRLRRRSAQRLMIVCGCTYGTDGQRELDVPVGRQRALHVGVQFGDRVLPVGDNGPSGVDTLAALAGHGSSSRSRERRQSPPVWFS